MQVCAADNSGERGEEQPLEEWVAAGHDLGTKAARWPEPSLLEQWAAELLKDGLDFVD